MTDNSENSNLRSISQGAALFILGKAVNDGLRVVINAILTNAIGATLYGIYAYGNVIKSFFVLTGRLGSDKAILKFIPQEDGESRRRYFGLAVITTIAVSTGLGFLLYISAPVITDLTVQNPLLTEVLQVISFVIPIAALTKTITSVFKALELLQYQILVSRVASPIVKLLGVLVALFLGYSLVGITAALVVAALVVLLVGLLILRARVSLHPSFNLSKDEVRNFYDFSVPLTFNETGSFLNRNVDVLMVGILLSGSVVGIYNVSLMLTTALAIPLGAFGQLFPPVASRLYSEEKVGELEALYTRVTRWVFTLALFPAAALLIFAQEVLSMFGPSFTTGVPILTLFVIGQLTNAAVGPSGYVLMMTGHQKLTMLNQWVLGTSNIVLNYVFITQFGSIGAALATGGILAATNIIRLIEIWYTERLMPYSLTFFKPIVACLIASGAMAAVSLELSGLTLLIGGTVIGVVVFSATLVQLGIEDEDKEFFSELLSEA